MASRHYAIPEVDLERMEKSPLTRSALVTQAIKQVYDDPNHLIVRFEHRLFAAARKDKTKTRTVTVSLKDETLQQLKELTEKTELGTEHVMRLAIESYLGG